MKLANTMPKVAATVTICLAFGFVLGAQSKPSKTGGKLKSKKPAQTAPASNPAPAGPNAPVAEEKTISGGPISGGPKRDPFLPLVSERKEGGPIEHLPPGKNGLVINTVRVDGTVRAQSGMIAVLSNADQHVYFVHEGDQLYDGDVEKIGLDGVTFRQNSKDAFGKQVERVVTKRIYASAGEQQ